MDNEAKDRSPLAWPPAQKRTQHRSVSRFKTKLSAALESLRRELRLLRGTDIIITTNLPVGSRGSFLIDEGRLKDPGVAAYFKLRGKPICMACDLWWTLAENVVALARTVEALRGIDRWGSTQMMDRAFTGFAALPPTPTGWRATLGVDGPTDLESVRAIYKRMALDAHPDRGGTHDAMVRLNAALQAAERELGGAP